MKDLKHKKDTNSYMQLCLQLGGEGRLYLMVPTYWDSVKEQWMGATTTSVTKSIIVAHGKDSQELQNNFIIELAKKFKEIPEEIITMFKPLEYWESRL